MIHQKKQILKQSKRIVLLTFLTILLISVGARASGITWSGEDNLSKVESLIQSYVLDVDNYIGKIEEEIKSLRSQLVTAEAESHRLANEVNKANTEVLAYRQRIDDLFGTVVFDYSIFNGIEKDDLLSTNKIDFMNTYFDTSNATVIKHNSHFVEVSPISRLLYWEAIANVKVTKGKKYRLTGKISAQKCTIRISNNNEILYNHQASKELFLDKTFTAQSEYITINIIDRLELSLTSKATLKDMSLVEVVK